MAGFYEIYLRPKKSLALTYTSLVEKSLENAFDWYRISPNLWIIYTSKDAQIWSARLKKYVNPGGFLFVCRLDITDRQGWMSKKFWEWLKKNQARATE